MSNNNKNAKKDRGRSNMNQFGLMQIPAIPNIDQDFLNAEFDDDNDEDLEAELNALMGSDMPKKSAVKKPQVMKMDDIAKLTSECLADDESQYDEDFDENDPELLKELQQFSNDDALKPELTEKLQSTIEQPVRGDEKISLSDLESRLSGYIIAEESSLKSGDHGKARRYKRAAKTLKDQIRMLKSGKTLNVEEIPPKPPVIKTSEPIHNTSHEETSKNNVYDVSLIEAQKITSEAVEEKKSPKQPVIKTPEAINKAVHKEPLKNNNYGESKSSSIGADNIKNEAEDVRKLPQAPISKLSQGQNSNPEQAPELATSKSDTIKLLTGRRNEYKKVALQAKSCGDKATAIKYLGIIKQFDSVIQAVNEGKTVDLSGMPPSPNIETQPVMKAEPKSPPLDPAVSSTSVSTPSKPMSPAEIANTLIQRSEAFAKTSQEAKEKGNNSKARRIQRIVKQYQEAIKDYQKGRKVDFDELPVPPGFSPIRVEGAGSDTASKEISVDRAQKSENTIASNNPNPVPTTSQSIPNVPAPKPRRPPMERKNSSVVSKQMKFLVERQKLFKQAALQCKKNDEMTSAIEYLKIAKGIDPLIEATKGGLPVDIKTIPVPPQLKEDFEIIQSNECVEMTGDSGEMYKNLESDLLKQLKMCISNQDIFTKQGDVASAARFENLAIETKKDIQVIKNNIRRNDPVPKFHYETRTFSMVRCNPELKENQMEITFLRGIDLPSSDDSLNSFIQYEFPFPNESPQNGKTSTAKNSRNPEYNAKVYLDINRKSRSLARLFKRNALKVEVFSKGGLFSSNASLGTVKVPISELESNCSIHNRYDIMNRKKSTTGKLEIQIKLREPLLRKQVENLKERWLVIGS